MTDYLVGNGGRKRDVSVGMFGSYCILTAADPCTETGEEYEERKVSSCHRDGRYTEFFDTATEIGLGMEG